MENIHAQLDAAVTDAYGWPADLPDSEIREGLLALNLERAEAETIALQNIHLAAGRPIPR